MDIILHKFLKIQMDDDVAIVQKHFVIDGIIEISSEAGVVPEQDSLGAIFDTASDVDQFVEVVTSDCRSA
jgi:hypothetical protein